MAKTYCDPCLYNAMCNMFQILNLIAIIQCTEGILEMMQIPILHIRLKNLG